MKAKSLFSCTQQELYLALPLAWALCHKNLSRFAKLKGFYTEGYINDRLADIAAAKAIPNNKTRKDDPNTHRVSLDEATEDCPACSIYVYIITNLKPTNRYARKWVSDPLCYICQVCDLSNFKSNYKVNNSSGIITSITPFSSL